MTTYMRANFQFPFYDSTRSSVRLERQAESVEIFSVDTNAISYTLSPETAGSCAFAEPVPGCSDRFEEEGERVTAELERLLNASTASWKVTRNLSHCARFSSTVVTENSIVCASRRLGGYPVIGQ